MGAKGGSRKVCPAAGSSAEGLSFFLYFLFIPLNSFWLSGDLKDSGLGQAASLGGQSARPKSLRKSLRIWPAVRWLACCPAGELSFFLFSFLFLSFPFGFLGTPRPRRPSRLVARRGAFLFPLFPIFLSIPFISYKFL